MCEDYFSGVAIPNENEPTCRTRRWRDRGGPQHCTVAVISNNSGGGEAHPSGPSCVCLERSTDLTRFIVEAAWNDRKAKWPSRVWRCSLGLFMPALRDRGCDVTQPPPPPSGLQRLTWQRAQGRFIERKRHVTAVNWHWFWLENVFFFFFNHVFFPSLIPTALFCAVLTWCIVLSGSFLAWHFPSVPSRGHR